MAPDAYGQFHWYMASLNRLDKFGMQACIFIETCLFMNDTI